MTARKKAARKKSAGRTGVPKKVRRRSRPPNREPGLLTATKYKYDQLQAMFWAEFGRGCGIPFQPDVVTEGFTLFEATVKKNLKKGDFDDPPTLAAALRCCLSAGKIATTLAEGTGNTEIEKAQFVTACDYLQKRVAKGQGSVCG